MRHPQSPALLSAVAISWLVAAWGCQGPMETGAGAGAPADWPPALGEPYPEFQLVDFTGAPFELSSLLGRIVLIEPVGMTCKACNAFSGGAEAGVGGFRGIRPQQGLESIERYLERFAGLPGLEHPDLVLVQLLLYDFEMGPPDQDEAAAWAQHFGLAGKPNVHVVFPRADMRSPSTYELIPGFQLLDRDHVLRFDSTGHRPRHNLYTELLPELGRLLG